MLKARVVIVFLAIITLTLFSLEDNVLVADGDDDQCESLSESNSVDTEEAEVKQRIWEIIDKHANREKRSDILTVTIDGTKFYVIDYGEDEAFLLQKESVEIDSFGESNIWRDSKARAYLNDSSEGGYLYGKDVLGRMLIEKELATASTYDRSGEFITTKDKVFLPSEADMLRTVNGNGRSIDNMEFTQSRSMVLSQNVRSNGTDYLLRSPAHDENSLAGVLLDGTIGCGKCDTPCMIRPAMWVDISCFNK